jgi:hypothetical protein
MTDTHFKNEDIGFFVNLIVDHKETIRNKTKEPNWHELEKAYFNHFETSEQIRNSLTLRKRFWSYIKIGYVPNKEELFNPIFWDQRKLKKGYFQKVVTDTIKFKDIVELYRKPTGT